MKLGEEEDAGRARYYSVRKLLKSQLLSKKLKIRIKRSSICTICIVWV
jgi:hypothetical protein